MALKTVVIDIMWNLDIIGSLTNHQTLMVDGDRLQFDTRYVQWLRRTVTIDSRERILNAIRKTFDLCEEVVHSYQCNIYIKGIPEEHLCHHEQLEIISNILENLQSFINRKKMVVEGLNVLCTFERYSQDTAFRIEMGRFMDRMQKLCRRCEGLKQSIISQKIPSSIIPSEIEMKMPNSL